MQNTTPNTPQQKAVPNVSTNNVQNSVPGTASKASPNAVQGAVPIAAPNIAAGAALKAPPSAAPNTVSGNVSKTTAIQVVSVRFRDRGKITNCTVSIDIKIKELDYCVVSTPDGLEYGSIISEPRVADQGKYPDMPKIIRIATVEDTKQYSENLLKEKEFYKTCAGKIEEKKLLMKLVEVDYAFDRSKIIFYFTAEKRVDFRDLVKDLAYLLKSRIDMRQIGVRDEAKMLGGFGCCGRELCCVSFLKDFTPVTIKMAKEQNLPLNLPKISGMCGRLMCCLSYENTMYGEEKIKKQEQACREAKENLIKDK
jgi:cell fate regulator YaaT (PSP1 superfamily)